jgi:hypothetical protein
MKHPLTRFKLHIGHHEVWLPPGSFIIGRSAYCQVVLDDPLVSRRHAQLMVDSQRVTIEDLNSINGVRVNGEPLIGEPRELDDGDRIAIGNRELRLAHAPEGAMPGHSAGDTLSGVDPVVPAESNADDFAAETGRADVLGVLGVAAEDALDEGRVTEAQRLLTHLLMAVLRDAKGGRPLPTETVGQAVHLAMRLAKATGSGAWFDYVVDLLYYLRRLPGTELVAQMLDVLRTTDSVDLPRLVRYSAAVDSFDAVGSTGGTATREVAQLLAAARSLHER